MGRTTEEGRQVKKEEMEGKGKKKVEKRDVKNKETGGGEIMRTGGSKRGDGNK